MIDELNSKVGAGAEEQLKEARRANNPAYKHLIALEVYLHFKLRCHSDNNTRFLLLKTKRVRWLQHIVASK
jgi:hypothetical protein